MKPNLKISKKPSRVVLGSVLLMAMFPVGLGGQALEQVSEWVKLSNYNAAFKVLDRDPDRSESPEKLFLYGLSSWHRTPPSTGNLAAAKDAFRTLIERYPESKLAPYAKLQLGRIFEVRDFQDDTIDAPEARRWYKALVESSENDWLRAEATLRLAGSYFQEITNEEAILKGIFIAENWLEENPSHPLATLFHETLGGVFITLVQDDARALEHLLEADRLGLADPTISLYPTYWRIARLAEKTGRKSTAIRYYTKLTERESSGLVYSAEKAILRLKEEAE